MVGPQADRRSQLRIRRHARSPTSGSQDGSSMERAARERIEGRPRNIFARRGWRSIIYINFHIVLCNITRSRRASSFDRQLVSLDVDTVENAHAICFITKKSMEHIYNLIIYSPNWLDCIVFNIFFCLNFPLPYRRSMQRFLVIYMSFVSLAF